MIPTRSNDRRQRPARAARALVACLVAASAAIDPSAQQSDTSAPELDALLAKATSFIESAVATLSSVVCEEHYVQTLRRYRTAYSNRLAPRADVETISRRLVSDYLLVQFPGARGWVPFRDVYSVDGEPVRDRENRLLELFVESRQGQLAQAEAIRSESSRYNLGSGTFDINVPTFALQFLLPEVRGRFHFRMAGGERVGDTEVRVLEYQEVERPTIIVGARQDDVPASGRFWVTPADGRVVQTRLETRSGGKTTRIDVRYGLEPKTGAWVAIEMQEHHAVAGETLESRATYTNFRQFHVETLEQVK